MQALWVCRGIAPEAAPSPLCESPSTATRPVAGATMDGPQNCPAICGHISRERAARFPPCPGCPTGQIVTFAMAEREQDEARPTGSGSAYQPAATATAAPNAMTLRPAGHAPASVRTSSACARASLVLTG